MKIEFTDKSQRTFDGSKDGFYPIQICLWLKEGNKAAVVRYEMELSPNNYWTIQS